jgi:hypothetical protein
VIYNVRHHQWAGKTGLCKWQLNTKIYKGFKRHDPAHLSAWRLLSAIPCKYFITT